MEDIDKNKIKKAKDMEEYSVEFENLIINGDLQELARYFVGLRIRYCYSYFHTSI